MRSMDCTDIQVVLSGLIDGELDDERRHTAERHIAECTGCRHLLDEAEAVDGLLQTALESDRTTALPDGFERRVLNRTIDGEDRRHYLRQWTTWAGWLAAAAAVVLAMTIYATTRSGAMRAGPGPNGTQERNAVVTVQSPPAYRTGMEFRSETLELPGTDGVRANPLSDPRVFGTNRWPSLDASDADDLYRAALLLRTLEDPSARHERLAHVREVIRYDGLLPRLDDMFGRLDAADGSRVQTAAGLLRKAVGELAPAQVDLIGDLASDLSLADALDRMSDNTGPDGSL